MTTLNKLFITSMLILGMQNMHILSRPDSTNFQKKNLLYENFSSDMAEVERVIFTFPQEHMPITAVELEDIKRQHTKFLSTVEKAKEFILKKPHAILDYNTLVTTIFCNTQELDTTNTTNLELCGLIREILQLSSFFHPENECMLVFLSIFNNNLETAIKHKKRNNEVYKLLHCANEIAEILEVCATAASHSGI